MATMTIAEFCDLHSACEAGRDWALAECQTMDDVWATARPEWLVWVATRPGVLCDRSLRLFAVFCARQVEHLLTDDRSRRAIAAAERFANGEATQEELAAAWDAAASAASDAAWAASDAAWARAASAASDAAWAASDAAWARAASAARAAWAASDAAWARAASAARAARAAWAASAAWAANDAAWAASAASDAAWADQAGLLRETSKPNFERR
jgi:hypothetical protein